MSTVAPQTTFVPVISSESPTLPAVSKVQVPKRSSIIVDFGNFLNQSNLLGLAVGFLIAGTVLDTSKAATAGAIMPLVESIKSLKPPQFKLGFVVEALFNFVIIMAICFGLVRFAKITAQPIPLMQVFS
jgi:hypothetical protein